VANYVGDGVGFSRPGRPLNGNPVGLFQALNDAVAELGPTMKVSQFEKWEPLGKARNPLFRLLALRAFLWIFSRPIFLKMFLSHQRK
jgi:hypothetical protein